MAGPKLSRSTLEVLAYFMGQRGETVHGLEIIKATGYKSGTVYPILERLERAGWLQAQWEDIDPTVEKRPRRRNYRLTGEGATCAAAELESASRRLRARRRSRR